MVDPNRWLVVGLVLALVALAGLSGYLYVEDRPTAQQREAAQLVESYYAALNHHDEAAVMTLMAPHGSHSGNEALGGDVLPVTGLQLRAFLHRLLSSGAFSAELTGPVAVTVGTNATEVSVPNRLSARLPDGRTRSVTGLSLLSLVTVDGRLRVDRHAWWERGYLGWSQWAGPTVTPVMACPAGSTPVQPGPAAQARPSFNTWWGTQAAMDEQSGRLVALATDGTWTFDVCTNTWTRMRPAREPPAGVRLVYDAYTDLTIAFPPGDMTPWTYSLPTNTWTPLPQVALPTSFLGFSDLVDNPLSGQVLLFTAETGDLWAYQVQTNTLTAVDQGTTVPPDIVYDEGRMLMKDRSTWQLWIYDTTSNTWKPITLGTTVQAQIRYSRLSYDPVADRLVLTLTAPAGFPSAGQTWVFDSQAHVWTRQHAVPAGVLAWSTTNGATTFDTTLGRMVAFSDGALSTYDTATDQWTDIRSGPHWPTLKYVDGQPAGQLARHGQAAFVYDPVNQRSLLIGGLAATGTGDSPQPANDVWAYTLATNTWTLLLTNAHP